MKKGFFWILCLVILPGCKTLSEVADPRASHNKIEGKFIDSEIARDAEQDRKKVSAVQKESSDSGTLGSDLVNILAGGEKDETVRGYNYSLSDSAIRVNEASIVELPEMVSYIEDIAERLIKQWPYETLEVDYKVQIDSSLSHSVNVSPQAVISVSLGTIRETESEDELAFILGHELSHLLLGHHRRGEYIKLQQKIVKAGFNVANASVYANNLQVSSNNSSNGKHYTVSVDNQEQVGKTIMSNEVTKMLMQEMMANLLSSSWSRTLEDEADLLGLDLMVRAGYNLETSSHVMQRLADLEKKEKANRKAMAERQQAQLSEVFSSQGLNEGINQALNMAVISIMSAGKDLWKQVGANHQPPEKREQHLAEYSNREYRTLNLVTTNETDYQRQVGRANVKEVIIAYTQLSEANKALSEEDIDRAAYLGQKVLKSRIGNSTKARILMYQVRKYQGNDYLALKNLQLIADWENAPVNAYDSIINEYMGRNRLSDAEEYLEMAQKYHGKEAFYGLEILLQLKQGNVEQAQIVYGDCIETGNQTWKSTCEMTIGDFKPKNKLSNPFNMFTG